MINNVIKEWFRYACDREGGRKEREERKTKPHRIQEDSDQLLVRGRDKLTFYKRMLLMFEL